MYMAVKTTKTKERSKNYGGARPGAGKPVSQATLRTQKARDYISKMLEKSLTPIVDRAIKDAIKGDFKAREWLSNYAWGKPAINLGTDGEGKPLLLADFDE